MNRNTIFLCADLVSVEWHEALGRRSAPAVLDGIGERQARVRLESAIPLETNVRLRCGRNEFKGHISECRASCDAGHEISVCFAEGGGWSLEKYCPKHLVDPERLVASGTTAAPPCMNGKRCPHGGMTADQDRSAEGVRRVAREVAGVCHNLDMETLAACFGTLYGPARSELLAEFVSAYRKTLGVLPQGSGTPGLPVNGRESRGTPET